MRRFSAHLGYLFNDRPLTERFAAAKAAGFETVEHPAPHGASAGGVTRGEKELVALPDRVAAFRDSIAPGLDYAEAIDCRAVHAKSGVRPKG